MIIRYFANMERQSCKALAEADELIVKFTAVAASKGISLSAESSECISTTGIIGMAQGPAVRIQ